MGSNMNLIVSGMLVLVCFTPGYAQTIAAPTPAPAPAAPQYHNLTQLLSVAGPFSIFLKYLQTTKTIETFQNQANNTEEGLTLFVPKDDAFTSLKNPSISNLTQDQLRSLCLFHGLPHYYTLANFKNLSQQSPISTFAGGQYTLNFTDTTGSVHINSGWTKTKITSAVVSTDPVAIYETDRVLLPEAIFGTDIPPTPAPVPAPDIAPVADTQADRGGPGHDSSSPPHSSSQRILELPVLSRLVVFIVGGMLLFW